MAPASIREKLRINPNGALVFTRRTKYQPIPNTAAILKILSSIFPNDPPNFIPKAIPGFSVKWILNQFPIIGISLCIGAGAKCNFIQNFNDWSTRRIKNITNSAFYPRLIFIYLYCICVNSLKTFLTVTIAKFFFPLSESFPVNLAGKCKKK